MRPKQWAKNIFLFVPLLFDEKLFQPTPLLRTVFAFVLFCLVSSAVYLLNDLGDIERDKLHPVKRLRPLASGQLPPLAAKIVVAILTLICLPLSWCFHPYFFAILVVYLVQNVAYTFWLKNVVILDVMTIAGWLCAARCRRRYRGQRGSFFPLVIPFYDPALTVHSYLQAPQRTARPGRQCQRASRHPTGI